MVRQRHGKLFDELDLSGLDSWAPELADAAHWLLAKYHNVFSLDPAELGCTHSRKHMIKVTDNTPFKEQFRWIPCCWSRMFKTTCRRCYSLVLSGLARVLGAMQWCWCGRRMAAYSSALSFATWTLTEKRTPTPCPRIQEALESLVGSGHFSCMDLKSGVWQIKVEEALKQYTAFTVG